MRAPTVPRSRAIGLNMTPMIDIVFLLIIFFLVSSHLAQQETNVELALPSAASGLDPSDDTTPRVTINLLPQGQILLAGNRLNVEQLEQRLRVENQSEQGNLEVRIRADRQVPYRFVEPLLRSCAQAGVWNVKFAVLKAQGGS